MFVRETFAVSWGKIAEIYAFWIPSERNVKTPWMSWGGAGEGLVAGRMDVLPFQG